MFLVLISILSGAVPFQPLMLAPCLCCFGCCICLIDKNEKREDLLSKLLSPLSKNSNCEREDIFLPNASNSEFIFLRFASLSFSDLGKL